MARHFGGLARLWIALAARLGLRPGYRPERHYMRGRTSGRRRP